MGLTIDKRKAEFARYIYQIWTEFRPSEDAWVSRCPNMPEDIYREVKRRDKETAKSWIVNDVVGYISECKNANRPCVMVSHDKILDPGPSTEVQVMYAI